MKRTMQTHDIEQPANARDRRENRKRGRERDRDARAGAARWKGVAEEERHYRRPYRLAK